LTSYIAPIGQARFVRLPEEKKKEFHPYRGLILHTAALARKQDYGSPTKKNDW